MKKIDLGQTITILANVGVIAGIVFLAVEVRQVGEQLIQDGGDGGCGIVFERENPDLASGGERAFVEVRDAPPEPGVEVGREIFRSAETGCEVCHSLAPDRVLVGPSLAGVGSTAGGRVPGMGADEYLRQSILAQVAEYYQEAHAARPFVPGETRVNYAGRVYDEQEIQQMVAALSVHAAVPALDHDAKVGVGQPGPRGRGQSAAVESGKNVGVQVVRGLGRLADA